MGSNWLFALLWEELLVKKSKIDEDSSSTLLNMLVSHLPNEILVAILNPIQGY
jgi:hypothetical protein